MQIYNGRHKWYNNLQSYVYMCSMSLSVVLLGMIRGYLKIDALDCRVI